MRGRIALQSTSCEITAKPFGFAQARHRTNPSEWRTFGVRTRPLILLLVEDRGVVEVLALCGGPARGDGAAFAISRNRNSTCARDSSVIPNGQPQCAIVDFFVRPRV